MFEATHTPRYGRRRSLGFPFFPSAPTPGAQPPGVTCSPGTSWNTDTGSCECPAGTTWDTSAQQCTGTPAASTSSDSGNWFTSLYESAKSAFSPSPAPAPSPAAPFQTMRMIAPITSMQATAAQAGPAAAAMMTPNAPSFITVQPVTPLYKQPWFWAAIAGGVVVVGGGSYMLFHKKS